MPSRASKHFFHKNRSQASLLNSHEVNGSPASYQASPIDSPLHSPAFPPPAAAAAALQDDTEGQQFGHPYPPEEPRTYQPTFPTRSLSQRSTPSHHYSANQQQPTIHLVRPATGQQDNSHPSVIDENPDAYYHQAPAPRPQQKEEPRKRRFFGLGSSTKESNPSAPSPAAAPQRLGRSISVRTKPYSSHNAPTSASRPGQQRWPFESSGAAYPQTASSEEADDGGTGSPLSAPGPPIPDKDPLRPSNFLPDPPKESAYRKSSVQSVGIDINGRPRFERQGSTTSTTWESPQSSIQQPYRFQQDSNQLPPSYQPSPSSATSASSHPLPARGQQEHHHHHHQELHNSRPPSQQSYGPPSPIHSYPARLDSHQYNYVQPRSSSISHTPGPMGPPQTQPSRDRRSQELAQQQQNQQGAGNREGASYQAYHQGNQTQGQPQGPPPAYSSQLGVGSQQGNNYRASQPSPMAHQNTSEQGRSTPPPSRSRDDLSTPEFAQLAARHDELQDKYRKVKKYYFDKEAQVQQLQNTLAHQRLAQSRTSLDDNEYINRFSRLDGAINNLAFNIRREWRSVPPWLAPAVNKDATTNLTKEMTAVGRACIARWLVDELFNRFFHPALDPGLSTQLKLIEKNLRRFAAPTPSDEEKEALMAKIGNWRLSTLEGLNEVLSSASATENRNSLTTMLVEKMVAALTMNLKDPTPPGLEGGVSMIVELAVGIACNLPLESRDVFVEYVYPNSRIDENIMKIESSLPPLTNPGEGILEEAASRSSTEKPDLENSVNDIDSLKEGGGEDAESSPLNSNPNAQNAQSQQLQKEKEAQQTQQQQQQVQKKKGSMFGGFMGGKKAGSVPGGSGVAAQKEMLAREKEQQQQQPKEEKVRFCAFLAVEVRGRSVLLKAPVWTYTA
ncbi:MAG: hypothetical protein LQ343_000882 [Gyalolechia ehrenbergii]|nr:MAG: hypothetical protein LQ343_000882 [Gyalolechia ehrenbergii]